MSSRSLPNEYPDSAMNDSERQQQFLRNLATVYGEAYASALVIVGNRTDADDVIQEVCVVLWLKFDEFEPGTNFRKWACSIAFNVAKNFVRKKRRRNFGLSDYALSRIEQIRRGGAELFELRQEVLEKCVAKLSETDRQFLDECYNESHSVAAMARSRRTSVNTVYARLNRLRRWLSDCVSRTLEKGG